MSAKLTVGIALAGASLLLFSCAGESGPSGNQGTAGSGGGGATGAAGATGVAGVAGTGVAGAGGGVAGASGAIGTGGSVSGTGGGAGTGSSGSGGGSGIGIGGSGPAGLGGPGGAAGALAGRGGGGGAGASGGGAGGRGGASGSSAGGSGAGGSATGGGGALPPVYDKEDTAANCPPPPAPPAFGALPAVANLPDPFLMTNGTRITSRDQWRCRRAEISRQMQHWVSGPKGAPPSNLTATFSGGRLTVVATQGSASITLTSMITTPSGNGPFPVVIGMNTATGSLPASIFTGRGVATMTFTSSTLVPDAFNVPRGGGTYFTMYPDRNAGAMIEWAWGVSRLIDGLTMTASQNKIDVKRIAVTGCSYQGKMALYAGAFDERIALVMPQESGGGGEASWRVMAGQPDTEHLEAAQGTAWYAQNLLQFRNADAPKLPVDMHELVAMVAPRAILTIANTGIPRLGSEAGYVSMKAATEVYKGLGIPDRIGFTQAAASGHCVFPSSQTADVQAFVDKFLAGMANANTAIAKSPYTTSLSRWITWTTPQLQ